MLTEIVVSGSCPGSWGLVCRMSSISGSRSLARRLLRVGGLMGTRPDCEQLRVHGREVVGGGGGGAALASSGGRVP